MNGGSHHRAMNRPKNNHRKNSSNPERNKSKGRPQNRRRRPNNRGQSSGPDKITKTYYVFIEKIQIARRKYYDDFHHQDPNRVNKLRRNFERAIQELREWEEKLTSDQKQVIAKTDNLDLTYSTLKEISPVGIDEVGEEETKGPHFIKVQEEAIAKFSKDEEESVGTMDDYRSYKGT